MIYYLEDSNSGIILLLNNDKYLVTSIADGLLDVHIRMFAKTDQTVMALTKHLNQTETDTGLRLDHNAPPVSIPLNMYPDVADKLKFIQLRKPAFEKLLTQYQFVSSVNTFGFGPLDISSVKYALDNPNIIFEYAGILKTTEDFAKQELSMLYNSVMSEQFRIFAVCNYWKDTINKATTKEDIDSIILKIPKSFSLQGGIDD